MISPSEATNTSRPIRVEYRLTVADVRRFVDAEDLRCWTCSIRSQKLSTAILLGLVLGLSALCGLKLGPRVALILISSVLVMFAAFGYLRGMSDRRRAFQLARDLGLPTELRVAISPLGVAKASGPTLDEPARRFAWSEVVATYPTRGFLVFRLRPADGVLLIPDGAFPSSDARRAFLDQARRWRQAMPGSSLASS